MNSHRLFDRSIPRLHQVDHLDYSGDLLTSTHTYMLGFFGVRGNFSSRVENRDAPEKIQTLLGEVASIEAIRTAEYVTHGPMRKLNIQLEKDAQWDRLYVPVEQQLADFAADPTWNVQGIAVVEQGDVVRRVLASPALIQAE